MRRVGAPIRMDLHLALCNFIYLKRAINFFVVLFIDPFFVDCIVLDKDTTHTIPSASFVRSTASRDTFGGFTFATFST